MGFLDDYEPVEDRIRKFWDRHPMGKVETELLHHADGEYIVLARLYRGDELRGDSPAATGLAREVETQRGVNATSALENCETSAIGRALANMGFAAKGKRPSREEMSKTVPGGGTHSTAPAPGTKRREPETSGEESRAPADTPPAADETDSGMPAGSDSTPDPVGAGDDHEHVWIPSPKLKRYEVCVVDGCLELRDLRKVDA